MSGKVVMLLTVALSNVVTGALFAAAASFFLGIGAVGMNTVDAFMRIHGDTAPVLRAGVYTEMQTDELVRALRNGLVGSWLDSASDQSSVVNNGVIHLAEAGMDLGVLINDMIYPIPTQALEDKDVAISLDKFRSKVTPITDDGLYAISYNEMARVKENCSNAINDTKSVKVTRALYATEHTARIPVLKTTDDADEETRRKRFTPNDLVEMRCALDKLKVPSENRRLVLCPDHVNGLFLVSQNFRERYNIDRNTGRVGNLYGFQVYEHGSNPVYAAAGKKRAVGIASDTGGFQCSSAFYTPRMLKATGDIKMYFSKAQRDPEYQRNEINFRYYFVCMSKKADTGMVMMSGYAASELSEG